MSSAIGAIPMFGQSTPPDDLISSNPIYQALLSSTGGQPNNLDAMASSNPQYGAALGLMNPGGGLNPQQAQSFGPLFALLMSLQGGG